MRGNARDRRLPWRGWAPGRVNLIGEHVDYLGGPVLPVAVDRFLTVQGWPAREWRLTSDVGGGETYARALGGELNAAPQAVAVTSDVIPGAGLSSSAALLVALAAGLAPDLDGETAARICQRAEQRATGVQVGIMDQFASALGRRGHALLLDCATLEYRLVPVPEDLVLAVVDSGVHRRLADTPYNERRREAEAGMPRRRRHVESETARVHEFANALEAGDRKRLGELLEASHRSLRDDFEVSTPEVDELVQRLSNAPGCLGARIMGAGFGGSVLALVDQAQQQQFEAAVADRQPLLCRPADGPFAREEARTG